MSCKSDGKYPVVPLNPTEIGDVTGEERTDGGRREGRRDGRKGVYLQPQET